MVNKIKDLTVVNWIGDNKGIFQAVVKVPAGFMTAYEIGSELPSLNRWKKGALQTIQFKAEGATHWMTVFAKKGTKIIIMDEKIAEYLEVGTVNALFYNTNLMDQKQYQAVNARNWGHRVFIMNED